MIARVLGIAILAMAVSVSAWAADAAADKIEYSKTYDACMAKSDGITVVMRDCIGAEQERQDRLLNDAYRKVSAKAGRSERAALVRAERAWVAFREAQCTYEAAFDAGGTLAEVVTDQCFLDRTASRAKEFSQRLK